VHNQLLVLPWNIEQRGEAVFVDCLEEETVGDDGEQIVVKT
jgi:hypothetical protein